MRLYWRFGSSFPSESVYIDFADWSVIGPYRPNRLGPTGGFFMDGVFRPRGSLYARDDDGWGDIVFTPGGDNHVGTFEELGDGSGVSVDETLL